MGGVGGSGMEGVFIAGRRNGGYGRRAGLTQGSGRSPIWQKYAIKNCGKNTNCPYQLYDLRQPQVSHHLQSPAL